MRMLCNNAETCQQSIVLPLLGIKLGFFRFLHGSTTVSMQSCKTLIAFVSSAQLLGQHRNAVLSEQAAIMHSSFAKCGAEDCSRCLIHNDLRLQRVFSLLAAVVGSLFFSDARSGARSHPRPAPANCMHPDVIAFCRISGTGPMPSAAIRLAESTDRLPTHSSPNCCQYGTGAQSCRRGSLRRESSKTVRYSRQCSSTTRSWSSTLSFACPPRLPHRSSSGRSTSTI
jgi:hypothetical protein